MDENDWDTVIALRKDDCTKPEAEILCNDDSTPPGDYHSRITSGLINYQTNFISGIFTEGDYYLYISGFDSTQFGDFVIQMKVSYYSNYYDNDNDNDFDNHSIHDQIMFMYLMINQILLPSSLI